MGTHAKPRFWRACRLYFRRFRIAVWFTVFVLLSISVYLNQVGLPDFVKRPLLDKLRQRGLTLQFSRLRLRWYQGVVADNVRFASADEPYAPQMTLQEIQVLINFRALLHRQIQVDSLVFHKGRLVWPVGQTNQQPRDLTVDNIETRLRFLPNDMWALDHFTARFAGAHLQLSGMVTNASAVRQWKFVQGTQPSAASAAALQTQLRGVADALERIRFSTPPDLVFELHGDARDLQSFGLALLIAAPDAQTPWGTLDQGRFSARLFPGSTNGLSRAEIIVEAAHAQTAWATLTNLFLHLKLQSKLQEPDRVECELKIKAHGAETEWASAGPTLVEAQWVHSPTNPVPLSGVGQLQTGNVKSQWGAAKRLFLKGRLSPPLRAGGPNTDASWGWWTNLSPYRLGWECHVSELQAPEIECQTVDCAGNWEAPLLNVTNVELSLYRGHLTAHADLDVATRSLYLGLNSNFDPKNLGSVLPKDGREWLEQFSWEQAPLVQGDVSLVLPAWTNRQPDWRAEVLPTLLLAGQFDLPRGGVFQRKLELTAAHSHLSYSNRTWHLPDLTVARPEGRLVLEHRADELAKTFYWHAVGAVDVRCVRPFLAEEPARAFDLLTFTQPPSLDFEIWGQGRDNARIGARGQLTLTNFTFRGESLSELQTRFEFTNHLLKFFGPQARHAEQEAGAEGLTVDLDAHLIYLTNGYSTMDPGIVCRAIGANVAAVIAPYHFLRPPTARVHGTIPLRGEEGADLYFDLEGGPFHWWKFNLPHVAGQVHWAGQFLTLSDIRAEFYGGQAAGVARFDFRPQPGTDFQFALGATNVQLHALMNALSGETNHLEGALNGAVSVTRANDVSWHTVNGFGELNLRDGLLWDIPLFGIFSPVLNGLSPGLGNSRASAATCSFVITNGYVFSRDLDIRSTAMRLKYRGTVDLESHVNARVEAELLRDVWAVGPVVSALFWPVSKMFEYKVSNTLSDPKMDPVFIVPRLVLFPLHPFRTLKNLFPENSAGTSTNFPALPK